MTSTKAVKILRDIENEDLDPGTIREAIETVLEMPSYNYVSKQQLVNAIRWLMEYCVI